MSENLSKDRLLDALNSCGFEIQDFFDVLDKSDDEFMGQIARVGKVLINNEFDILTRIVDTIEDTFGKIEILSDRRENPYGVNVKFGGALKQALEKEGVKWEAFEMLIDQTPSRTRNIKYVIKEAPDSGKERQGASEAAERRTNK